MSIVLSEDFKKIASRAIRQWGIDAQMDMMIEECSELITELIKKNRVRNGTDIDKIIGELVDVELMLGEMKYYVYDILKLGKVWESIYNMKVERLKERLKV